MRHLNIEHCPTKEEIQPNKNNREKPFTKYFLVVWCNHRTNVLANYSALRNTRSFHDTTTSTAHSKSTSHEQHCLGHGRIGTSIMRHKQCQNYQKTYWLLQSKYILHSGKKFIICDHEQMYERKLKFTEQRKSSSGTYAHQFRILTMERCDLQHR